MNYFILDLNRFLDGHPLILLLRFDKSTTLYVVFNVSIDQ